MRLCPECGEKKLKFRKWVGFYECLDCKAFVSRDQLQEEK